ncbi:MAG: peptidylprolyl isomerase, partial [Gemmatimonadota bacterium]|nr:peptidylprolyl isomerase [Gemmatimonadota bacterium]
AEAASAARSMSILADVAEKLAGMEDASLQGRLGLARGLETLLRLRNHTAPSLQTGRQLAGPLWNTRVEGHERTSGRIRTLALSSLAASGGLDEAILEAATRDPEPEVRRVAYGAILQAGTAYRTLVPSGLSDPSHRVRVAALAAWDRWLRPAEGCGAAREMAGDPNPHVALAALDLLARPCPDIQAQRAFLSNLATLDSVAWHAPAHALVALAGLAPEQVRERLTAFRQHPSPFARAWAARAAAEAADVTTLEVLAMDADANVRTAALTGLRRIGARRPALFLDALDSTDPQLVMTASSVLSGNDPEDVSRALDALARFTARRLETERDVRIALLDVLEGSPHVSADQLRPYLEDFDPEVARRAAALMRQGGVEASPSPEPGPATSTPNAQRLTSLARSLVVLEMGLQGEATPRGLVSIALRPDLAATNADRFARLVEDGALDGLTFHRVVPNFVIQGGSPGANEYAGHGAYSRDEISSEGHWRGTVGVSTRGRDTGDAQIFVNLIDNTRLDFNYTILGAVVEGMEVVDALPEGAVIRRGRLQRRRAP